MYVLCLFYFPLKCDPLEKNPRKAEGYAYQDIVRTMHADPVNQKSMEESKLL